MNTGADLMVRRGRLGLAVFGIYYGLMVVLPVMVIFGLVLAVWPFLAGSLGYAGIVLACVAMIYQMARIFCCRVIVTRNGEVVVINPFRRRVFRASSVEYLSLTRVVGSEKAGCAHLSGGGRVKMIAVGPAGVDVIMQAINSWRE